MIIRPATHNDITALSTLARHTFSTTFGHLYATDNLDAHLEKTCSAAYFKQELDDTAPILVAEDNGELVGYLKYGKVGVPVDYDDGDLELQRLYVMPAHQSKGIGRMLIDHMFEQPDVHKAPSLYLSVWSENLKAQSFYQRYGFKHFGEYKYYVGSEIDREFIYRKVQRIA